jgi:uncharacterized protein
VKTAPFYTQFERQARKTVDGCRLLLSLMVVGDGSEIRAHANAIADIEHECDTIAHGIVAHLRKTLIPPLNRDEIYWLTTKLDDVIDLVDAIAERVALYDLRAATPEAESLARVLLTSSERVLDAVTVLRDLKQSRLIVDNCGEITRLKIESQTQTREALARLFREERDPIVIMKWKEIYELFETATGRCEGVADLIEGVVIDNA